jgi:putative toxin-antitoxin system antitoxin component (TIGR02293 family)
MSELSGKSTPFSKTRRRSKASAGSLRRAPTSDDVKRVYARGQFKARVVGTSKYKASKQPRSGKDSYVIVYRSKKGVDEYVRQVASATPMQLVEIERLGVVGSLIKDLSKRMEIPSTRIFRILGVPKATAEKKASAKEMVAGSGGQAALGMVKLLGIAQEIVRDSTAPEAKGFDSAKWLGQWIERPQPALGGRKPADLLDTPTGVEVVARLLGSIQSGAFQ